MHGRFDYRNRRPKNASRFARLHLKLLETSAPICTPAAICPAECIDGGAVSERVGSPLTGLRVLGVSLDRHGVGRSRFSGTMPPKSARRVEPPGVMTVPAAADYHG